jgi:hypothetical protein
VSSDVVKRIHAILRETGYAVRKVQVGTGSDLNEIPCLILEKKAYPGAEAHLFTIADAALWIPAMTPTGDILLYRPPFPDESKNGSAVEKARVQSWRRLMLTYLQISKLLGPYKKSLEEGYIPSVTWAHYDAEWFRNIREAPDPTPRLVHDFIHSVDESIRTNIQFLNESGFSTIESCSGLPNEHLDREPYRPYVMFSERSYQGVAAHLFTLADIAQWIPGCAPHSFDIVIKQKTDDEMEAAWNRLLMAIQALSPLIKEYQELIRDPTSSFRHIREQARKSDSDLHQLFEEKTKS